MKSIITNIKKTTKNVVANTKDLIEGDETRPANWEAQEAVSYCRNCDVKFDLAKKELWKHHCRKCGNVVCEECLQRSAADNKKYCLGCVRGEVPGDELVEILTEMMREAADPNSKKQSKLKARRVIDKGIAQMTNMFDGEEQTPVARRIRLRRGSMYGEDGRDPHNRAPLAISGYFEFLNKSTSVCCIKLLYGGGDYLYEAPRPSYTAVPPGMSVHCYFNQDLPCLEMLLLYNNINPPPSNGPLVYDTTSSGVEADKISASAAVSNFKSVHLYRLLSKDKNVLLKYKGETTVEPRNGGGIGRVGLLGRLRGRRFAQDKLDFRSNVDRVEDEAVVASKLVAARK